MSTLPAIQPLATTEAQGGVDLALTSPPYEGSAAEGKDGIDWAKQADGRKKQEPHGDGAHPWGYTRPSAIITSPPYEGTTVSDLNASPLNGPIGDASRQKDKRKGG